MLCIALLVPSHLPPLSIQSRWHSEPLRLLSFNNSTFFENTKGYPYFTHNHQALLTRYMRIRNAPWILLSDVGRIPGLDNPEATIAVADDFLSPNEAADPPFPTPAETNQIQPTGSKKSRKFDKLGGTPHLNYIRHLQRRQPARTTVERFGAGYQDYLQAPLQPLTDNLESITYEVFEKDPIKYEQYFKAIVQALSDWREHGKGASGPDRRIVVAVVGAGRGPLVTRALEASEAAGIPIDMWAVEKNPNAYVLLQRHNEETWKNRVNIVKSDMRSWKGPLREVDSQPTGYIGQWPPTQNGERAGTAVYSSSLATAAPTRSQPPNHYPIDILISELLGSFADNELSPECLDGILPLLNPTDGISIPCSYSAYLTPIAAPKLHADISTRAMNDPAAPNTPYVVMLHAIDYLSTTSPLSPSDSNTVPNPVPNILQSWSFSHRPTPPLPNPSSNSHNTRHARLSFNLRDRAVCHGLAGYFEAVLYPGVELSTNPLNMEEKSPGMMSWFPIFFPLKVRILLPLIDPSSVLIANIVDTDLHP